MKKRKRENTHTTKKRVRFKKIERKHAFDQEKNKIQEKRNRTRLRPRKKERKQDLDQEKRKKTISRLRKKKLVFRSSLFSFINSHLFCVFLTRAISLRTNSTYVYTANIINLKV